MKRMTRETRIAVIFSVVAAVLLGGIITYQVLDDPDPIDASQAASVVVRDDSHRLSSAENDKVTLVEFLDFECESCRAAFPFVESLREAYDDEVTFVVRYFPIDSHVNARNAAHAVEAASRQGKFEDMYARMYETQAQWGESQESQAAVFRGFAEEMGLDMAKFDADVDSPEVAERVQKDVDDGLALGVSGTPTFFLNGEMLQPQTTEDFTDAIDAALAK